MKTHTPFLMNGFPKLCAGCAQPFPVRNGRIEALLGEDDRLYCYAGKPECAELAVRPVALKRAA